jgi:hypothetical protein
MAEFATARVQGYTMRDAFHGIVPQFFSEFGQPSDGGPHVRKDMESRVVDPK